ncbi:MAG: enoyl-CoA hydratase/isomerase family protein [Chloroflexi bacterium]|nr:enoyl-CoA hydratase/isomerase family protein [Chloroflexota bacterium]
MSYQNIIYQKEESLVRIILNRPEKLNALSYALRQELVSALKEAERDDAVRVIILKGAGRAFSAGYDLTPAQPSPNRPPQGYYIAPRLDRVSGQYHFDIIKTYWVIWDLLKPVIAQIHGYCLAGATELTSMCDIRFVAEDAQVGYPPVRNLAFGNVLYAPWLMGITKAKEYMFTGDSMSGHEAHRVGWATRVYPADQLEEETEKFARRMALIETDLIMMTKRAINRTFEIMGFRTALDVAADLSALTGFRPSGGEFGKAIQEKGLKGALEARDGAFADYRTSKSAI